MSLRSSRQTAWGLAFVVVGAAATVGLGSAGGCGVQVDYPTGLTCGPGGICPPGQVCNPGTNVCGPGGPHMPADAAIVMMHDAPPFGTPDAPPTTLPPDARPGTPDAAPPPIAFTQMMFLFSNNARAVAAGKFDSSTGLAGFASIDRIANKVMYFPQNATGGFSGVQSSFPTGPAPQTVVAADLNHDGKTDLVTANLNGDNLTLLLQNPGAPIPMAFIPSTTPTGAAPSGIAAADLNGDGFVDLAVANSGAASISILLQKTTSPGIFTAAPTVTISTPVTTVQIGDLNKDNLVDLAVPTQGNVKVVLQDPAHPGQFLATKTLPAVAGASACLVGDWDKDGANDLFVLGTGGIVLLHQDGVIGGTFGAPMMISGVGLPKAMLLVDLNGDGRLDLVVADAGSNQLVILLNESIPGSIAFAMPFTVGLQGTMPTGLATADFNGDGRADLAVSSDGGSVELLIQK